MAAALMPQNTGERCINLGAELEACQTSSLPYLLCRLNLFLSKNIKFILNAPFSPIAPPHLLLPPLTSKPTAVQHAATVAAVQALITHVQSPLPMGSCVTPVDHFAILFLFQLWPRTLDYTTRNKNRKREKRRKPYFHLTAVFKSTRALGRHFLLKDLCCPTGCTSRRDFIRPVGVWSGVPLSCRKLSSGTLPGLSTE